MRVAFMLVVIVIPLGLLYEFSGPWETVVVFDPIQIPY